MRRDLVLLLLLGLLANGAYALTVARPGYMDAYYYFNGAVRLARGAGFTEPYVWNYFNPNPTLPAPSHLYWMPLTSIIAAPFVALAEAWAGSPQTSDALFRAAQIPMVLTGAAFPLLSYGVAWRASGLRRHAVAAALLTLFSAFYFPYWANTDAFALYGLVAGGALFAFGRACAAPMSQKWFFLSGLLAGLAHLTRTDGILIALCLAVFTLWQRSFRGALSLLLGYGTIIAPWILRNLLAVGSPLAPNGLSALWLTEYNDLFNYPVETLTVLRYWALGPGRILQDKWTALVANFQSLVAVQASIIAFPLALVGAWRLRRRRVFQAAAFYLAALFAAMTFVFTFPGLNGAYFHSGTALLPFISAAALVGLDASVEATAQRLKHWQPEKSKPIFTILFVVAALTLTLIRVGVPLTKPSPGRADGLYEAIGSWLEDTGERSPIVAVNNPPAFYYLTGRACIVVPNGDLPTLLAALNAYGARWAVLDANHPAGLASLYQFPESEPRLRLRAEFQDDAGRPAYLFERIP